MPLRFDQQVDRLPVRRGTQALVARCFRGVGYQKRMGIPVREGEANRWPSPTQEGCEALAETGVAIGAHGGYSLAVCRSTAVLHPECSGRWGYFFRL